MRRKLADDFGHQKEHNVDFLHVTPEGKTKAGKNKQISIDQILRFKKHAFEKPVKHSFRLAVIQDAHKMGHVAQNALLKILEEPPKHLIVILEADKKSDILPTIISRLSIINIKDKRSIYSKSFLFSEGDLKDDLEKINEIDDPISFLDQQMKTAYTTLIEKFRQKGSRASSKQFAATIKKLAQAKQMLTANVDTKFVLIDLLMEIKAKDDKS